jgi:hypothetical protein
MRGRCCLHRVCAVLLQRADALADRWGSRRVRMPEFVYSWFQPGISVPIDPVVLKGAFAPLAASVAFSVSCALSRHVCVCVCACACLCWHGALLFCVRSCAFVRVVRALHACYARARAVDPPS